MLHITVWNENLHEKTDEFCRTLHPNGLHETIAAALREDPDLAVRTATPDDPECGLSEEVLTQTDVLFWWGHLAHDRVPDEIVERVQRHVLCGMGLVVLHSGHHSKIFRRLMGTSCNLGWHDDARERLFVCHPAHPIAAGLPPHFEIPSEECYSEPFGIPNPDETVFLGWYTTGEAFRAGCCFYRENGRIFYFQPGHETDRSFVVPEIRRIYRNAAHWAAPQRRIRALDCPHVPALENADESRR